MPKTKMLLLQEDMALEDSSFHLVSNAVASFEDTESKDTFLKVETITTHSGMLINNRVYPGISMRKSVKSWVSKEDGGNAEYQRPVLLNHNTYGKPIGRVIDAKFVSLASGDAFNNDFLNPVIIDKGQKVNVPGSGYIVTNSIITDQDAILAILKSEYKTVSASFRTNKAICSICSADYLDRTVYCGHWPGETYDIEVSTGKKGKTKNVKMFCYAITGDMYFKEWSYVTMPADAAAQTVKMEQIQLDNSDSECYIIRSHSNNAKISSVTLCDTEGNSISQELLNFGEVTMKDDSGKIIIAVNTEVQDEITQKVLSNKADEKSIEDETESSNDSCDNGEDGKNQDSTPAGETKAVEEPANSDADNDANADVSLSDEEFALANVARSMGTCLLTVDSSELFPVHECLVKNDDHTHKVIVQRDGNNFYGMTYDFEGDGPAHSHVYEHLVSDLTKDAEAVDLEKTLTRGASTGPDHSHEVSQVERDWDTPDTETLSVLAEKLADLEKAGKLTDLQLEKLVTDRSKHTFCGPNRSFPVPDGDHIKASLRLITRYKGSADVKSRIMSSVNRNAKELGYDEEASKTEGADKAAQVGGVVNDQLLAEWVRKSADLEKKVGDLTDKLSDKTNEVQDLTDASAAVHKALNTSLAQQLVVSKWVLDKDDTLRINDAEELNALISKYAERSAESLNDSINDLVAELDIYLRDHRGGINKRILSTTQPKIEDDTTLTQVQKGDDKTNTKAAKNTPKRGRVIKSAKESLSDDFAVE